MFKKKSIFGNLKEKIWGWFGSKNVKTGYFLHFHFCSSALQTYNGNKYGSCLPFQVTNKFFCKCSLYGNFWSEFGPDLGRKMKKVVISKISGSVFQFWYHIIIIKMNSIFKIKIEMKSCFKKFHIWESQSNILARFGSKVVKSDHLQHFHFSSSVLIAGISFNVVSIFVIISELKFCLKNFIFWDLGPKYVVNLCQNGTK